MHSDVWDKEGVVLCELLEMSTDEVLAIPALQVKSTGKPIYRYTFGCESGKVRTAEYLSSVVRTFNGIPRIVFNRGCECVNGPGDDLRDLSRSTRALSHRILTMASQIYMIKLQSLGECVGRQEFQRQAEYSPWQFELINVVILELGIR